MRDDAVYLRHIAECISRVEKNTAAGKTDFLNSHTVQDATLTQPKVEWSKISAFRNILVHNYLGIDLELIWKVIEDDLPVLKRAVSEMLQNIAESDT